MTLRSWVYRLWLLVSVLATGGYLLFHIALQQQAGMLQKASLTVSDLLLWSFLAGATLVIVLTGGSISSERGTMADSVLSRGISRYQYFLGKWHARVFTVLGTFFVLATVVLIGSFLLLHDENLSPVGGVVALLTVAALLLMVITCGVTISAMVNSTLVGVAVLWVVLYGGGFALSLLPEKLPSLERAVTTPSPRVVCATSSPTERSMRGMSGGWNSRRGVASP